MLMTDKGMTIRFAVKDVRETGRNAMGVRFVRLESGDKLAAIEPVVAEEKESGSGEELKDVAKIK